MVPKPHRAFAEKVSGYADEASAYLRRRRLDREPFARVHLPGGRIVECSTATDEGRALFLTASRVIDEGR